MTTRLDQVRQLQNIFISRATGDMPITPIVCVGIFILLRELLLSQQDLITLAMYLS